jgi:hypothetical protein
MHDLYPLLAVQVVHPGWSMNRLKLGVVTTAISRPRRARIAWLPNRACHAREKSAPSINFSSSLAVSNDLRLLQREVEWQSRAPSEVFKRQVTDRHETEAGPPV